MKKILIILLLAFSFLSCEKDDICDEATSTTPKITIEFYDFANPLTLKNVTNLGVISPTLTTGFGFSAVNKISIPLNTATETTTYSFVQNGSDTITTNDNTDVITFNYSTNTVYVSRACGYKIVFDLTNTNANLLTTDSNNWIKNIIISKSNIENQNETHIKIYF